MRLILPFFLALAALFATPASAQDTPDAPPGDEVVVTGVRDREEQVRDFVEALTPAPGGSIPRLIDEVCPVVVGLDPAFNRAVAARLRVVAGAAGLRVGGDDCVNNIVVIAKPDKRKYLRELSARRPEYFGLLTPREIDRLVRSPGPAASWQLEGPVDANGIPLAFDPRTGTYVNRTTAAASRVRATGRRGFESSVLVVEKNALNGLTATQVADYAAMRLLGRVNAASLPATAPPTVLSVLEAPVGAAIPASLTAWDLGFLRGLSSAAPDLPVGSQRSRIAQQITKELNGAGRPED